MDLGSISTTQAVLLALLLLWDLVWKGFALWKAAKNDDQVWFVCLMVISSIGILPILYLFLVKPKLSQS